jgi:steroid delta-isomerase-like uncharacterized protein
MKTLLSTLAIATLVASCNMGGNKNSSIDDRLAKDKAAMMNFYDNVMNKHNVAYFDTCVAADFVEHCAEPGTPPTRDGDKKVWADFFTGYPDYSIKVNFMVADSMYVVTHYTMTGTNTGAIMGMPATGKKIDVDGVDIVRFVNGKAVEHWGYNEEMKMMTQMGMMPDMSSMMPKDSGKVTKPDGDKAKK